MRLALSEEDCQRFGCPKVMDLDLSKVTNREAAELQRLGFSPNSLYRRLQARDPDDENWFGDLPAWDALIWLALRRHGITVDVRSDDFWFDLLSLRILPEPQPEDPLPDAPGKAPGRGGSTSSRRTSSTRSKTSKTRSTPTG